MVPVPALVPVPAPYLDHKKQFSKQNKKFVTNLAFLMLIKAAFLPRNLSSQDFIFNFNEGNQIINFILCL
jgi:hypothetical protein